MIEVKYSEEFIRVYNKLPTFLREEVNEKIVLFRDRRQHQRLRVHKLHGEFAMCWSFRVNFKIRVVFIYPGNVKNLAVLVTVGDHSIYG